MSLHQLDWCCIEVETEAYDRRHFRDEASAEGFCADHPEVKATPLGSPCWVMSCDECYAEAEDADERTQHFLSECHAIGEAAFLEWAVIGDRVYCDACALEFALDEEDEEEGPTAPVVMPGQEVLL